MDTLEIAASLGNMDLPSKTLQVSTEVDGVQFDDTTIHVICVDGEALSYTHSIETVSQVMKTIAYAECKRIQDEKGARYEIAVRKDKEDGTKYTITQIALGYVYNSAPQDLQVFSAYPISHARLTKRQVVLTTTDIPVMSSILLDN
jgi:hypothetical protein